jgi:hypothetical protein
VYVVAVSVLEVMGPLSASLVDQGVFGGTLSS